MNLRNEKLVLELREVAGYVRAKGAAAVYSEFAAQVESVANAIEMNRSNPAAWLRAVVVRKWAKYTWCAPTCEMDDFLAGHPKALELGNSIYAAL